MQAAPDESLWAPFDERSRRDDLLVTWEGNRFRSWSWGQWREQALRAAGALRSLGVQPGDRVAWALTNSFATCAGLLGAWLAGAQIVSLPLRARGLPPEGYRDQIQRIITEADATLLVSSREFVDLLQRVALDTRMLDVEELATGRPVEPTLPAADEVCFVQYSSGSTSEPKGCMLTPRAIAAQLRLLADGLGIDAQRDTGVVWLPMSHDMGLFGCVLLTYWTGHRLVLGTPERFVTNPASWFADCACFGATVSAAPNFAIELAARAGRVRHDGEVPMRRLVVAGERVEASTLRRAIDALGPERLPPSSLMPAYGMAEATLAVSMASLDAGATITRFERDDAVPAGDAFPATPDGDATWELVSAGPPLPGCAVGVVGEGAIGQLSLSTPSLASGYLGGDPLNAFADDRVLTGDLGFMHDGEVYVSGRIDDLINLAGRKVYARDIEIGFAALDGIRPGNCVVVDLRDGPSTRLVALAECVTDNPDYRALARSIKDAAWRRSGVQVRECVFLPRGTLPKTPSGKVQRFRCRDIATHDRAAVRVR